MKPTENSTQKQIIKLLTQTHQNPEQAFKKAIEQAQTKEQAEQIKRIMQALNIKPALPGYNIPTNNKQALRIEIDTKTNKLYFIELSSTGTVESRQSLTEGELVAVYNWIIYQRNNGNYDFMF